MPIIAFNPEKPKYMSIREAQTKYIICMQHHGVEPNQINCYYQLMPNGVTCKG